MPKLEFTKDIMTTNVISCDQRDSLAQARNLMKEYNIRHIPVIDNLSHEFKGVITQRALLKEAFNIANKFGMDDLEHQESKRKVQDFLELDIKTIAPDTPLIEAADYFVHTKHGCLPVVEEGRVVGIVTSADFVKLSMTLLQQNSQC